MSCKKLSAVFLIILLFFNCTTFSNAMSYDERAIVLVVDASGGMLQNVSNSSIINNYIEDFVFALPSNYNISVVAYNEDICLETEFVSYENKRDVISQLKNISYFGYSNAGLGLSKAIQLLDSSAYSQKDIILLYGSEIVMQDIDKTNQSNLLFQDSTQKAVDSNVNVNVINLACDVEGVDIFQNASNLTDGSYFYCENLDVLGSAISSFLYDDLQIKRKFLAVADANGENQTIAVTLPSNKMSNATVFITSNNPITSLVADVATESCIQFSGSNYSILQLIEPTSTDLKVTLQTKKDSQIKIEIIPEFEVSIVYEIIDNDVFFMFKDSFNNKTLLNEDYFNDLAINLIVDDIIIDLTLNNGQAVLSYDEVYTSGKLGYLDFSNLPANIIADNYIFFELDTIEAEIEAEEVVLIEEKRKLFDFNFSFNSGLISFFLVVITIALVIILLKQGKLKLALPNLDSKSMYSYIGKLDINIVRTKSGVDINPVTFNLFRINNGRKISLYEVLTELAISEPFPGCENIFFKPVANKNILMLNKSDCTILKDSEILLKNKSHIIALESKFEIIFQDEKSEIVVHYKNI